MKFYKQKIKGVYLIEPEPFVDDRGVFRRHFDIKEFKENSISGRILQANISENKFKHTLRGFHYQKYPHGEGKTLSCIKGAIYDIVVDLRPNSKTYLKWVSFELDENNRKSIHIPPGCANAFLTRKDNSIIHYYCSQVYTPKAERGIRFDDRLFKFKWPHKPKVISDKDNSHPNFIPKK